MGLLSADLATKRLQSAQGTQDGIEGISSWMLHHTDSVRILADAWLNLFRTEGEERRVVLFYIMNDVVQRAKKKHVDVVCATFEQPVIAAVSIARFSEKLRGVMSRCLKLIGDCKAFTSQGMEKMTRLIADPNGDVDDGNYEIDTVELAKKIEAFMQSVVSITNGYEILKKAPCDLEDQINTRMKDRKEGAILLKETRTAILKVEKFREAVAHNNKRIYEFVDALESAKRLFNMQLRDVAVVEDAYVKFGQGVREVQDEVSEMLRTGVYPAGSPPRDAPSPSAEDDVFAAGVEQVLNKMRPHDVTDEADMDVEEDSGPLLSAPPPAPTLPPLPSYPPPWEKNKVIDAGTSVQAPSGSTAALQSAAANAALPGRPSLVERAAALAAHMPTLASHMGIDPRARPQATAAASSTSVIAAPPVKKPSLDTAAMQQKLLQQGYVQLPAKAAASTAVAAQQASGGYAAAAAVAAGQSAYTLPPPPFPPNIPPRPQALPAQWNQQRAVPAAGPASAGAPLMVQTMQQQQQQPGGTAAQPAPPISTYSAPPPGYPPSAVQYASLQPGFGRQQQQPVATAAPAVQQQLMHSIYSSPPPLVHAASYGGASAVGGSTNYQQQPPPTAAAVAAATAPSTQQQQVYGMPQPYGRSNSSSGSMVSPNGGPSQFYNAQQQPGPGSSGGPPAAGGTPYTPSAPGYRGRKGSDGGNAGTLSRGGYGRGGYSGYGRGGGGGYGGHQEEMPSNDAYQPQYPKDPYEATQNDGDMRQQFQPRGGRGYGRGGGGVGYGRGFQRGGPQRSRGFGSGRGGNYGSGGYGSQGY